MLALILLQVAIALSRVSHESPDLIHDPVVLDFSRVLARKAISERHREQGAFVVRTAGLLYFVAWPPSEEKEVLRWYGRFPEGTVAIVHTHPPWHPAASPLDIRAARGAKIPVYVITPYGIAKTTGGASEVVLEGDWMDAVGR
jgi:hypothetical protein